MDGILITILIVTGFLIYKLISSSRKQEGYKRWKATGSGNTTNEETSKNKWEHGAWLRHALGVVLSLIHISLGRIGRRTLQPADRRFLLGYRSQTEFGYLQGVYRYWRSGLHYYRWWQPPYESSRSIRSGRCGWSALSSGYYSSGKCCLLYTSPPEIWGELKI